MSKGLHIHAIPIVFLSIGLFLVSILGNQALSLGKLQASNVSHLLTAHLLSIKQQAFGPFHITKYELKTQANTTSIVSTPQTPNISAVETVGKSTQLQVLLQENN